MYGEQLKSEKTLALKGESREILANQKFHPKLRAREQSSENPSSLPTLKESEEDLFSQSVTAKLPQHDPNTELNLPLIIIQTLSDQTATD